MKPRVYIETTVVSYLAARPTRDIINLARQEITRQWWPRRDEYELYISQFVLDEAACGDPEAAAGRLAALEGLDQLPVVPDIYPLAESLVSDGPLPEKAATDALHVALAIHYEMDILLTWNCTHLANARILGELGRLVRSMGLEMPVVCTPEELLGE